MNNEETVKVLRELLRICIAGRVNAKNRRLLPNMPAGSLERLMANERKRIRALIAAIRQLEQHGIHS